jgi:hypothetical protein
MARQCGRPGAGRIVENSCTVITSPPPAFLSGDSVLAATPPVLLLRKRRRLASSWSCSKRLRRGSLGSQPCSTLQWRPLRNFDGSLLRRPLRPPQYEVNIGVSSVMTRACCSQHKRAALIDFYSSKCHEYVLRSRTRSKQRPAGRPDGLSFQASPTRLFSARQGGQCLEGSDLLLSQSTERSRRFQRSTHIRDVRE